MRVWSLAKVFHTCGKNCGKSTSNSKQCEISGRKIGVVRRSRLAEMNLWDEILARIETKVNRHSFYTWFQPTTFVADDRSSVTVRVPNALFKDWLTKHYAGSSPRPWPS